MCRRETDLLHMMPKKIIIMLQQLLCVMVCGGTGAEPKGWLGWKVPPLVSEWPPPDAVIKQSKWVGILDCALAHRFC